MDDHGRDATDALPPGAGARLDRFAAAFDRLDAGAYAQFAVLPDDRPEAADAVARTELAIGGGRRRAAIRAAVEAFRDAAARAYSRRMALTDTLLLFQSLPDRPDDRVRFAASLERAVVALILWDELDTETRDVLVGPWAALAEEAAGSG